MLVISAAHARGSRRRAECTVTRKLRDAARNAPTHDVRDDALVSAVASRMHNHTPVARSHATCTIRCEKHDAMRLREHAQGMSACCGEKHGLHWCELLASCTKTSPDSNDSRVGNASFTPAGRFSRRVAEGVHRTLRLPEPVNREKRFLLARKDGQWRALRARRARRLDVAP